jgi:hypothetical protein
MDSRSTRRQSQVLVSVMRTGAEPAFVRVTSAAFESPERIVPRSTEETEKRISPQRKLETERRRSREIAAFRADAGVHGFRMGRAISFPQERSE